MSRSCVCRGNNANCRFCSGLGTIPDGLATALTTHAYRPASDKLHLGGQKPQQQWMTTEITGVTKKTTRISRFGPLPPAPPRRSGVAVSPRIHGATQLVRCLVGNCSAMLNPRNVAAHTKKMHAVACVTRPQARRDVTLPQVRAVPESNQDALHAIEEAFALISSVQTLEGTNKNGIEQLLKKAMETLRRRQLTASLECSSQS